MTEVPATSRRRDRGRAQRSTGPSLAPLPRLTNPWRPLEILLGGQDFQRPPGIGEPRQRRERGTGGALGTPAVAAPGRCRNFGHGFAGQFIPAPTALSAA